MAIQGASIFVYNFFSAATSSELIACHRDMIWFSDVSRSLYGRPKLGNLKIIEAIKVTRNNSFGYLSADGAQ